MSRKIISTAKLIVESTDSATTFIKTKNGKPSFTLIWTKKLIQTENVIELGNYIDHKH